MAQAMPALRFPNAISKTSCMFSFQVILRKIVVLETEGDFSENCGDNLIVDLKADAAVSYFLSCPLSSLIEVRSQNSHWNGGKPQSCTLDHQALSHDSYVIIASLSPGSEGLHCCLGAGFSDCSLCAIQKPRYLIQTMTLQLR